jgi:hypothetical protein
MDRRGTGNMNGNRNGFNNTNNNERGTYGSSRPSRFSGKRSRSRSPVQPTTHKRPSRFDNPDASSAHNYNSHGNDYKRPRTDSSRPPHVKLSYIINRYSIQFSF